MACLLLLVAPVAQAQVVPISPTAQHFICDSGCGSIAGTANQGASNVADPWYVRFTAAQHFICDSGCGGSTTHTEGDPNDSSNLFVLPALASEAGNSYSDGQKASLSIDLGGNLRTLSEIRVGGNGLSSDVADPPSNARGLFVRLVQGQAVAVSGTFWQATQPVSGTFWPTAAGSPSATRLSDGAAFYDARSIRALTFAGDKVDASGSAVTVSSGTITTITNVVHVDDNSGSLTVDGPVTDAQLRATPVPVSGTVTVTDGAGALNVIVDSGTVTANAGTNLNTSALALEATQLTGNTSLASVKTNTDPLVASGAGGYVRQDSTATIAKETGGNLATIATNTTGIATAANQTTEITSLASIDSKLPSQSYGAVVVLVAPNRGLPLPPCNPVRRVNCQPKGF